MNSVRCEDGVARFVVFEDISHQTWILRKHGLTSRGQIWECHDYETVITKYTGSIQEAFWSTKERRLETECTRFGCFLLFCKQTCFVTSTAAGMELILSGQMAKKQWKFPTSAALSSHIDNGVDSSRIKACIQKIWNTVEKASVFIRKLWCVREQMFRDPVVISFGIV